MDEDSDDEDVDDNALLEYKTIPHHGGINRIRVMPHPETHIVATWSETGKVHVFDASAQMRALDTPGMVLPKDVKPIYTNHKHGRYEGYALDWSSVVPGRLLSGDSNSKIYLTQADSSITTEEQPFVGHKASVEDVQWSPSEKDVFVSGSVDKTIKVWDVRAGKKPQLSVVAHDADVNVMSWNRYVAMQGCSARSLDSCRRIHRKVAFVSVHGLSREPHGNYSLHASLLTVAFTHFFE
jgi:ribosome assembly protein RRB1